MAILTSIIFTTSSGTLTEPEYHNLRIMNLIISRFAPHPQPLSHWEKGLGDEGSVRRSAFKFMDVI
jgi:hypothetical protein